MQCRSHARSVVSYLSSSGANAWSLAVDERRVRRKFWRERPAILQSTMRRTILRIEKDQGEPLDIEVNGRRLVGSVERGLFYTAAGLLALGALWVTVAVVLPFVGVLIGLLFSLVGIGLVIVVIVVVAVLSWVVLNALLERSSRGKRVRDDWEE